MKKKLLLVIAIISIVLISSGSITAILGRVPSIICTDNINVQNVTQTQPSTFEIVLNCDKNAPISKYLEPNVFCQSKTDPTNCFPIGQKARTIQIIGLSIAVPGGILLFIFIGFVVYICCC